MRNKESRPAALDENGSVGEEDGVADEMENESGY
jgi:hypothetical protein